MPTIAPIVAFGFGILMIAHGIWRSIQTIDRPPDEAPSLLRPVVIGVAAMVLAMVFVAQRESAGDPHRSTKPTTPTSPWFPLSVLVVPIVVAWLQFELYFDVVWMFPLLTFLGGLWTGAVVGERLVPATLAPLGQTLGIAVLGLPAGLLGFWLPLQHFNTHLTDVHVLVSDDGSLPDEYEEPQKFYRRFSAELPPFPELPPSTIDVPMFEVSEPVELGTLMERGEVELREGELYVRQPDGSMRPMSEVDGDALVTDFAHAQAEARAAADEREREAVREAQRQWHAEIERLRRGGRILSGG